ncbi:MAG: hypothetical protein ABSG93_03980 [Solirubrobacteraceae bacterium]|jgi:hypothetical protein
MAGQPAEPPPSGHRSETGQQAGAREREGEREPAEERVGPVTIARHLKDDGRALIIYTRDMRPPR